MSTKDTIPPGFTLRHVLRGHKDVINRIAWSPNGNMLASPSGDHTIRLWNAQTGRLLDTLTGESAWIFSVAWSPNGELLASSSADQTISLWHPKTGRYLWTLSGHSGIVFSVAWSPNGELLASSSADQTICLWNVQTGQSVRTLIGHSGIVFSVAWSPNGELLASSSADQTIRLWNVQTGQSVRTLIGHSGNILSVTWSPNGQILASGSADKTIRLWNTQTGQQLRILEGHTNTITCVSYSCNGDLLASKSQDGSIRIWHTNTWKTVIVPEETAPENLLSSLAFHPDVSTLATAGEKDRVIRIWDLDVAAYLETPPSPLLWAVPATVSPSVQYTNAKVVLVGDSGVGKSGLGLVLTGQPFVPTESTHGRRIWIFEKWEFERGYERKETRETLLWDLAGQPGYRLIHQLHLSEVVVALLVFDSHSETDPFAGIHHWDRALRMAQRVQGNSAPLMKKFLVAARMDRGGKSVSRERINELIQELAFDGYFETSAKEGQNIRVLAEALKSAIDWEMLPKVTSTDLFQRIKAFLITEKEAGSLLSTLDNLYRAFVKSKGDLGETEDFYAEFETCIGLIESKGLIRRLSFGNLVLLQPELLDTYASALVNAVKDEPDGFGSISEEKVRAADFSIPTNERIADQEQEKLLLIAMVEDLLRYEIALREQGYDGPYLVFPSQSTRENPDLPDPEGKAVIFSFEGPVLNIYATLAVRLSHSGLFVKKELWKNALTYTTKMGGTYGMFLHNIGEGRAKLTLFFNKTAREETRFHFEEYIESHLLRRALPETIQQRRIFVCTGCGTPLDDLGVTRRQERGFNWMRCGVCETIVSLLDIEERFTSVPPSRVAEMDIAADTQRDLSTAASRLQGKIETGDFDVFLCHSSKDKAEVRKIREKLKERGVLPWLDEEELPPGQPWQRLLEKQIKQIKSAAVFVGKDGIGPWEQMELETFLRQFIKRRCPVIPAILGNPSKKPKLPPFLEGMTWVDFRQQDPDPLERLIWGITGVRKRI